MITWQKESYSQTIPTIVMTSDDDQVIDLFRRASTVKGFHLLVQRNKLQTIWETLERMVVCLVLDMDVLGAESLALISIINKIRPRLPVVILTSKEEYDAAKQLAEYGIFYRGVKPLSVQEIEHILHGVNSCAMRNRDYLLASL